MVHLYYDDCVLGCWCSLLCCSGFASHSSTLMRYVMDVIAAIEATQSRAPRSSSLAAAPTATTIYITDVINAMRHENTRLNFSVYERDLYLMLFGVAPEGDQIIQRAMVLYPVVVAQIPSGWLPWTEAEKIQLLLAKHPLPSSLQQLLTQEPEVSFAALLSYFDVATWTRRVSFAAVYHNLFFFLCPHSSRTLTFIIQSTTNR
jgi:hypothetical protein